MFFEYVNKLANNMLHKAAFRHKLAGRAKAPSLMGARQAKQGVKQWPADGKGRQIKGVETCGFALSSIPGARKPEIIYHLGKPG